MKRLILPVLALVLGLGGCARAPELDVELDISHVVGDEPLRLDEGRYRSASGEEFTVGRLRYYLSLPRLRRADGSWFEPRYPADSAEAYHLVDDAVPASRRLRIAGVPAGEYTGIEFLVGIDEERNHAGIQSGALDPARGMFWTWKSGYIFLVLEGRSPQSPVPGGRFSYHIGGGEPSLARRVYLPFGERPIRVEERVTPTVHLVADVAALFSAVSPVSIAKLPEAMDPAAAKPLADNAAAMFRVDHLHHEPRRRGGG
jgi:hypothetical protein